MIVSMNQRQENTGVYNKSGVYLCGPFHHSDKQTVYKCVRLIHTRLRRMISSCRMWLLQTKRLRARLMIHIKTYFSVKESTQKTVFVFWVWGKTNRACYARERARGMSTKREGCLNNLRKGTCHQPPKHLQIYCTLQHCVERQAGWSWTYNPVSGAWDAFSSHNPKHSIPWVQGCWEHRTL